MRRLTELLYRQLSDLLAHRDANISRGSVVNAGVDTRIGDLAREVIQIGPAACCAFRGRTRGRQRSQARCWDQL